MTPASFSQQNLVHPIVHTHTDIMIIPVRCFSCGKVYQPNLPSPGMIILIVSDRLSVIFGSVILSSSVKMCRMGTQTRCATGEYEPNEPQRCDGPARSHQILLPANADDSRRLDREALTVDLSARPDLRRLTVHQVYSQRAGHHPHLTGESSKYHDSMALWVLSSICIEVCPSPLFQAADWSPMGSIRLFASCAGRTAK